MIQLKITCVVDVECDHSPMDEVHCEAWDKIMTILQRNIQTRAEDTAADLLADVSPSVAIHTTLKWEEHAL